MKDERMQILEMIAQGKITPEQGADLLSALETEAVVSGPARWLYVRVSEPEYDKVHVNIRIPVSWASKVLKFIKGFSRDVEIDMEEIYLAIQTGEPGQIIQVDTDEGQRIEIWLEV